MIVPSANWNVTLMTNALKRKPSVDLCCILSVQFLLEKRSSQIFGASPCGGMGSSAGPFWNHFDRRHVVRIRTGCCVPNLQRAKWPTGGMCVRMRLGQRVCTCWKYTRAHSSVASDFLKRRHRVSLRCGCMSLCPPPIGLPRVRMSNYRQVMQLKWARQRVTIRTQPRVKANLRTWYAFLEESTPQYPDDRRER